MGVAKPTLPSGTTASDLLLAALLESMPGDRAYIGAGQYSAGDIRTKYANQTVMLAELAANLTDIGELAEKPTKADSKQDKLKTRNYALPGKRSTTMELSLAGLSNLKKDYLESNNFAGQEITIVLVSRTNDRVVIYNGMRWTADWSGETDGLFSVVLSTEFSGATAGRVYVLKVAPAA